MNSIEIPNWLNDIFHKAAGEILSMATWHEIDELEAVLSSLLPYHDIANVKIDNGQLHRPRLYVIRFTATQLADCGGLTEDQVSERLWATIKTIWWRLRQSGSEYDISFEVDAKRSEPHPIE